MCRIVLYVLHGSNTDEFYEARARILSAEYPMPHLEMHINIYFFPTFFLSNACRLKSEWKIDSSIFYRKCSINLVKAPQNAALCLDCSPAALIYASFHN
jgi:hypothetical protein